MPSARHLPSQPPFTGLPLDSRNTRPYSRIQVSPLNTRRPFASDAPTRSPGCHGGVQTGCWIESGKPMISLVEKGGQLQGGAPFFSGPDAEARPHFPGRDQLGHPKAVDRGLVTGGQTCIPHCDNLIHARLSLKYFRKNGCGIHPSCRTELGRTVVHARAKYFR